MNDRGKPRWYRAYSYGVATLVLFLASWVGQFIFQLIDERNSAATHGQEVSLVEFWPSFLSSTLENWQSEFLQLLWQVAGLAAFLYWGSSQSRESDERIETKIDVLVEALGFDPGQIAEEVNRRV